MIFRYVSILYIPTVYWWKLLCWFVYFYLGYCHLLLRSSVKKCVPFDFTALTKADREKKKAVSKFVSCFILKNQWFWIFVHLQTHIYTPVLIHFLQQSQLVFTAISVDFLLQSQSIFAAISVIFYSNVSWFLQQC